MNTIPMKYTTATKKALIAAAGCGPIGAFSSAADVATITGIWGTYLYTVARGEHVEMNKETAVQICKSVLLGAAGYYAGCKMATRLFNFIPGAGTLLGMGISALTNILFTYRFALTVCTVFSENVEKTKTAQLALEMISAFRGNGTLHDVKEIVLLCKQMIPERKKARLLPGNTPEAIIHNQENEIRRIHP